VVPAHNEGSTIEGVLDALARLDYPREQLSIVLVDDGSTDDTGARLEAWAYGQPHATVVRLPARQGKYEALNRGYSGGPDSELVAVCDSDLVPHPDWLRRLVAPFADERVGATAAYLRPANADRTLVASYGAVESWVNQLVTSSAKDRLGLCPPTLGAAAYRRTALEQLGGFGGAGPGGDVKVSLALARLGWRTRFVRAAVADNLVVERLTDYWHQHLRWARNLLTSRGSDPARALPIRLRLEEWAVSAGYVDRLVLAIVLALGVVDELSLWVAGAYFAILGVELVAAVAKAGAARRLPRYVVATAVLFGLDVVASLAACGGHVLRRPRVWLQPRRS
jgi:cellulose synthase/poly-beta-1,6-N-acetylglucosamine synthase-like glycosyltransferase